MHIAQVAPLFESVPPKLYGGTERVVCWLTESLVAHGHDVTLYASGGSQTSARLVTGPAAPLRLDPCGDALGHHYVMFEQLARDRDRYDLIHFHTDYLHFPLARHLGLRELTTLHGRLDLPALPAIYAEFPERPVVAISRSQQSQLPQANWAGIVHHGMPKNRLTFHEQPGDYLAFLGRISPEKGLDRAIEIATRLGVRLRVAAKVDRADREYYLQRIAPLLHHPWVEFIGEISDGEKNDFLGQARALLFPIDWPEPFGLVLIESLACGTPVIAFRRGAVPEIIDDGDSGFLVETVDQAVAAVARLPEISRHRCREIFDARFTVDRMMNDYLAIYETIAGARAADEAARGATPWRKSSLTINSPSSPPRAGLTNEPAY